jgi:Tol biopolymer transport system component
MTIVARRALAAVVAAVAVASVVVSAVPGAPHDVVPISNPAWAPDGNSVAFAYATPSRYSVATVGLSGHAPIRTIYSEKSDEGCCDRMFWSRTGRIVFVANFTLTSVPVSGGRATHLFRSTSSFFLSPNGETAIFDNGPGRETAADAIGLVPVGGGRTRMIPKPKHAADYAKGLTPDGTELLFVRYPVASASCSKPCGSLMVVPIRGGAPVPLRKRGLIRAAGLPADAELVKWSPNGRWIAFVSGELQLEVVSTAGGRPRVISAHFGSDDFAWSPNSTRLAYDCCSNGKGDTLFTVHPDGTHRIVLWRGASRDDTVVTGRIGAQWSPDGTKLTFEDSTGIWVVNADGSGLKRIV